MKKRIFSFLLAFIMLVGMLPVNAFAAEVSGTQIPVDNNVINISDNKFSSISSYHATLTALTIGGANVVDAYEDGKNIYVMLASDTPEDATVTTAFQSTTNKYTVEGAESSATLSGGEAVLSQKMVGKYNGRMERDSVTYTINFMREKEKTTVPVRVQANDSATTYNGVAISFTISDYFEDGEVYYLIEGDTKTALEGRNYTFRTNEGGTHTLTFGAGNVIGDCPDYVTITVEVTEIKSGIWIGQTSSNGSWDYVLFKDADGNEIEDLTVELDGKTIKVKLPKNYDPNGKITATFSLTQNNGLPLLTTTNATVGASQWNNSKYVFIAKTFTLNGGKADFSFYYCNQSPKNESAIAWKLNFEMLNDLPVLAEGVSATAEATMTAGQSYSLDLDSLFTDADGDALTYQVSVNGVAETAAADYTFSTTTAGTYTLVFTANDGKGNSTETYTVTLTVENASDTHSMIAVLPEEVAPKFYVCSGYDESGADVIGDAITFTTGATTEGMTAYTLNYPTNADSISVRAEGWGGMAFAAEENTTVTLRQVQMCVVDYDNNPAESTNKATYGEYTAVAGENGWLLAAGTEYTFTATPQNTDLKTTSQKVTLDTGAEIYTVQIMLDISNPVAITVPTGAKAQLRQITSMWWYRKAVS